VWGKSCLPPRTSPSQLLLGRINSKQHSWLVIWEAGIVIELPARVFLLYPSALFFHFNVDIDRITGGHLASPFLVSADALLHLIVVTDDKECPTPENSVPLSAECGQGSCVWFNQASMFQTSELGYPTVRKAWEAGAPTSCPTQEFIKAGVFPTKKP
jgi:hypothetical protein